MVIGKIPRRTIRRDFLQFFSIIMLVAIASMTYTLFTVALGDISRNYELFKKDYVQEDGYFITSRAVDEELLGREFEILVEKRLFGDIQQDGVTLRVFSLGEKINRPYIQGERPQEGQVLLDPGFFKAHHYKIGDKITIAGQEFTISGVGYLPDYIYVIKNDQDFLPDPEHFGVVMMPKEAVERLFPVSYVHYYSYKGRPDVEEFKRVLHARWGLLKFITRDQNPRIIYTEMKVENAQRITLPVSLFIILVSSLILFIVMRRVINNMHAEIGTLYSLGYDYKDVFKVFMRFPLYIWLFGAGIGILLGYLEADPFAEFYRSYFTLPKIATFIPWEHVLVAMLLPAVFIFFAGYLALKRFFRLTIVQMLHGVDEIKFGTLPTLKFFDRFKFETRIMLKHGWRHFARELILLLGIVFSTILMIYGMTAKDAVVVGIERAYTENFRYEYLYMLNSISKHPEIELKGPVEPYNVLAFEVEGVKANLMIYGIRSNSAMIKLFDKNGREIPISDRLVISKPFANKLGVKEGGTINLRNKFSGKRYTLKVEKIADLPVGNNGYMELESFNRRFGFTPGEYGGIFAKEAVDIPAGSLFESYTKSELITTIKTSAEDLSKTIGVMALIAAVLALLIVYVLSNLSINENRKNIGILKMLGYKENAIFKMILGFNHISFFFGFILGLPLAKWTIDGLMRTATKDIDFAMDLYLSPNSVLSAFVVLLAVFLLSRFLVRRKIARLLPIEILRRQVD